jgi:cytochrome c-type biogenesis protein CcmF
VISEIGNFFLAMTLGFGGVQVLASWWGVYKGSKWLTLGRVAIYLQGICVACAFLTLLIAFYTCDFSLLTVVLHDHTHLPWYYRIAATWGNHQGSLLLFVLILSSISSAFTRFLHQSPLKAHALIFQGLLTILFLTFLLITSNPFESLPFPLAQGKSLNPLLQDRGLMIHPPMLYLGYVGFSAPFSLALAALWSSEKAEDWMKITRPWVLLAWGFLTAGITLGSWWAYYELGWGGWWFWDPVENASLMPWLAGTALLHTLITGKLYRWGLFLSLLTFGLSLLGTFLVRSGLITSVHNFANDAGKSWFLLCLISGIMGFAFLMWVWKAPRLKSPSLDLFSREGALLMNSILISIGLATVILGTLYPFINQETLSVGAPYFERTFIPLMLPLFLLIPIGSLLRKEKESLLPFLITPLTATLGALTFILYYLYPASLLALSGITCAIWVMSGTVIAFIKKRLSLGGSLAHVGVAVSLLGVSVGGGFRTDESKVLGYQDQLHIGEIPLTLQEVQYGKEPTHLFEKATLTYPGGVLTPEKRVYQPQNVLLTESAIATNGLRDLYVILGPYQDDNKWLIRASYIPLAPWIWIGGALMVLGAFVKLSHSCVSRNPSSRKSGNYSRKSKNLIKNWVPAFAGMTKLGGLSFVITLHAMTLATSSLRASSGGEAIQKRQGSTLDIQHRAHTLAQEIRCPVCLGQSIAESDMAESETLKTFILEQLKEGKSEEEIQQQLRHLYGDKILFRPPFETSTWALWLAPYVFFFCTLFGIFGFLWFKLRRRGGS